MCAAAIDPGHLKPVRQQLRGLLLPGMRELHFQHESRRRQRLIADRIAALPTNVRIYVAISHRTAYEGARARCLEQIVSDLLAVQARRLVLDSRDHRDSVDERTLFRALGGKPSWTNLTYEHRDSAGECLLWIPDAVAWCYGAGGDWRRRIEPVVTSVTEV